MRSGSSGMRSSGSSGMRSGGSSGARSSSGRRQMSYNTINRDSKPSNRTFVKRAEQFDKKVSKNRVSYADSRSNGNIQRYEKYVPSATARNNYSYSKSSNGNGNTATRSNYSNVKRSSSSTRSSSNGRSSSTTRSSSAPSRSFKPATSSGSRSQPVSRGSRSPK
jgi:hypothetical protein